ncbi:thioesterase family protein [Gordonia shandongensis]|uniref:thioesterase family protein n=1 Tax=Gordonia shandongensis TaxID=376351 RepID=UPI00040DD920|nr:thioesterase family protein [Gordonia shandongensis]
MSTDLAHLVDLAPTGRADGGRAAYRTTISPVFTIGDKVHGGSIQMIVAEAARRAVHDLGGADRDGVTALAIASDFLAAPDPADVDVEVTLVKTGRTVSLARVDVVQGGRTAVTSTVTLGRLDTGEPVHRGANRASDLPVEPPADIPDIYTTPVGQVVHLGQAIENVILLDEFPALRGETGEPVVRGWTRPRDADDLPDVVRAGYPILVCDLSPPVVMNLGMFGWAPTVQLTTYLRRVPAPGWLRFAASSTEVGAGMFAEDHVVLDSTGALVAQSRQLALIPAESRP